MSDPRVFGPGTFTLALTRESVSAACGHFDIAFIKSINVAYDSETRSVKTVVEFYRSHHAETSRQIEESVRIARSLGWLEVRY